MDNGHKNTPKVLTTNDIRNRAQDWTLAGDVGLLAHIEQFSENIINKTQEIQKSFNELVDDFEDLYTKVGNITNQFLALQNCQFVENRVYDEETPTEEKHEVQVQNAGEQEKLLLMQYKRAVEVGVKLLDTHFQEVQLPPNSDSDDDDDDDEISTENSIIWKPKNPYGAKRFPLLIGSAEWWADDHVGLGTEEDILNSDKIISGSESDMESLKSVEKTLKSSSSSSLENVKSTPAKPVFLESSSEDLFGIDKNENIKSDSTKGSTSLLAEPEYFLGDSETETKKSDSSSENRPPVNRPSQEETAAVAKPKKVDSAFTRELMAKLVSVTNKNETDLKEKEKPREEILERKKPDESLFDETDDSSDLFSTKIKKKPEKLAGSDGLFFDGNTDDDNLIKSENDLFSKSDLFESDVLKKPENTILEKAISEFEKKEVIEPRKSLTNDLFDDLHDDDTLFATKPTNLRKTEKSLSSAEQDESKTSKNVPAPETSWDVDEGLFDNIKTDFDDDFFKSSGLFDTKVIKAEEPKKIGTETKNMKGLFVKESAEPTTKIEKSVFDSSISDDPFEDPFGFLSSSEFIDKKLSFLDPDEEDLFSNSFKEKPKPAIKAMPLPVDDDATAAALFEDKPNPADSVSMSSSRSSLFDDVGGSKSRLASVFEKDKNKDEDLFGGAEGSFFSGEEKPTKEFKHGEKSSLFDECNDGDDLFSDEVAKPVQLRAKDAIEDLEDDLFKTLEIKRERSEPKEGDYSDADLFSDSKSDAGKPKPPNTLSLKTKKSKPVGKLNIPDNLKVKFESVAKHISPGVKPPKEEKEEKDEVLDVGPQPSALLKCPSKDRVKIPGRRRPQSRRARQEAIRNSGTWDEPIHQTPKGSLQSPIPSNPLSPSTDEEDFFKVPELDTNFEREDQSIFKTDLFESKSSKLEENLLFDGAPILSPLSPKNTKLPATTPETEALFGSPKSKSSTLFDDNFEGDENLFKATTITTTTKPSSALFEGEDKIKNSLFDLDDEEDDLFGGATSHLRVSKPPSVEKFKQDKDEKKKENSSFVDPLGLMTKD